MGKNSIIRADVTPLAAGCHLCDNALECDDDRASVFNFLAILPVGFCYKATAASGCFPYGTTDRNVTGLGRLDTSIRLSTAYCVCDVLVVGGCIRTIRSLNSFFRLTS